jgi:hypothetical protein
MDAFEKLKERQRGWDNPKMIYRVGDNNQPGDLEYVADPQQAAKRAQARAKTLEALNRVPNPDSTLERGRAEVDEAIMKHSPNVEVEEGEGVLVGFVRSERAEEVDPRVAYQKARQIGDLAGMIHYKPAAVEAENDEQREAMEVEYSRTADAVSMEAEREAVEEEIAIEPNTAYFDGETYFVEDEEGSEYTFATQDEAEKFAESLQADELGDRARGIESRSTMEDDE